MSGLRGLSGKDEPIHSHEQFFAKYASLLADDPERQKLIRERKAKIQFWDYDWGLNDAKK